MPSKSFFTVAIILSFLLAVAMRSSFLYVSEDLYYGRILFISWPPIKEFDWSNDGKSVIGYKGFPFSAYSDCRVEMSGTLPFPICPRESYFVDLSVLLNTFFYLVLAFIFYRLSWHVQISKNKSKIG